MTNQAALEIAKDALLWVASDDELMSSFLGWSGVDAADLRASSNDPQFLGAVLDFVLMDDQWVISASQQGHIQPEKLLHARAQLPGGDNPHWT